MATVEESRGRKTENEGGPIEGGTRSKMVARSLREVAKLARSPAAAWLGAVGVKSRWHDALIWGTVGGFVVLVAIPVLVAAVYLGLMASDQYASEARFAVRGGSEPSAVDMSGAISFLAGMPQGPRVQDSLILTEYLQGRGIVEDLDRDIKLRDIYGRPQIDYFSRFDTQEPIEELVYYWRHHTYVNYDTSSGTITFMARAFTPADALAIARKTVELSDNLVNNLSEQARQDALRLANVSLQRAESNLEERDKQLRDLRNSEGVLDATKTADAMTKMVSELKLELIHMEQDYDIQKAAVSESSPQLQVQAARIKNLRSQIQQLEDAMTGNRTNDATLASAMTRFDRQQLEQNIAEKQYVSAAAALEGARLEMEGKHVYLATFLEPVLAQEALYPRRWWLWSIVCVASLALWGALVGIAVLVRNYIAI